HTRCLSDWSSDVCSSDLVEVGQSATVAVAPNDPNAGDTAVFSIRRDPAFGTATIDPGGQLTYVADGGPGITDLTVGVTDNGSPRSEERRVGKEHRSRRRG